MPMYLHADCEWDICFWAMMTVLKTLSYGQAFCDSYIDKLMRNNRLIGTDACGMREEAFLDRVASTVTSDIVCH